MAREFHSVKHVLSVYCVPVSVLIIETKRNVTDCLNTTIQVFKVVLILVSPVDSSVNGFGYTQNLGDGTG